MKGVEVEAFTNIERCFVKLDELIDLLELLKKSKNYGVYNIGSKMMSYYKRLINLAEINQIPYKNLLIPKEGKATPIQQNLDTSKIYETFNLKFS